MLQKTDDPRQSYIIDKIKELKIRFPVAELSERMAITKGKVSEALAGKRPISDLFFNKFCEAYELDGNFSPFRVDDPLNIERAKVVALERKLAMVMSWVYELQGKKRSYEECLEDIDNDTIVVLTDLRRAKK